MTVLSRSQPRAAARTSWREGNPADPAQLAAALEATGPELVLVASEPGSGGDAAAILAALHVCRALGDRRVPVLVEQRGRPSTLAEADPRLHVVSGPALAFEINTPTYRRFDASLGVERGRVAIFPEGSEGIAYAIDGSVALRPAPWARIETSTAFERIDRERDGSEFARTVIPRVKVEIQPTRAFFFRTIAEYRAERRAALEDARTGAPLYVGGELAGPQDLHGLRIDLLASYEPTPGTAVYLGYGSSMERSPLVSPRELERTNDGFFLKLAYRFRR